MEAEKTEDRQQRFGRHDVWRRVAVAIAVVAGMIALLALLGPDGATYEEYLRIEEGMSRREVVGIIGEDDYWHHYEGDTDVTNWVNEDGTYIKAVFDESDVLVEVSWESGWDPRWEKE